MFDIELIKHVLKYEIKWGTWRVLKATIGGLIFMLLLLFLSEDGEGDLEFLVLFAVLIPVFVLSSSSLIPRMVANGNQQSQSGSFSWKYLHSIIPNRRSFIVAHGISGVVMGLPPLILGGFSSLLYGADILVVLVSIPAALLLLFQLKIVGLIQTIEMPRRIYFRYSDKSEIIRFFRGFMDGVHKMINGALFFFSIGSVSTLLIRVHIGFAIIVLPLIFLFTINYSLNYLLKIWRNENYSFWKVRREFKKTSLRFSVIAISVLAHYVFFGFEVKNENKAFRLVEDKKIEELKRFEFKENDLNRLNSDGYGLIHLAIKNNDIESVKYLVGKGSSIETPLGKIEGKRQAYRAGLTPLMYAIDHGATEIAQYLIDEEAELDIQSPKGFSAISLATYRCHPKLVKLMKEKGANIEIATDSGLTPIFYTVQGRGCLSAFVYLKESGANLAHLNKDGLNYLQYGKQKNRIIYDEIKFINDYKNL